MKKYISLLVLSIAITPTYAAQAQSVLLPEITPSLGYSVAPPAPVLSPAHKQEQKESTQAKEGQEKVTAKKDTEKNDLLKEVSRLNQAGLN